MSKHCGQFVKCNNAEGCFGCEYEEEQEAYYLEEEETQIIEERLQTGL